MLQDFVALLPKTVTPLPSPKIHNLPATAAIPPSWKEYQDAGVGISFRYPPYYQGWNGKPDNIPGLDCSAKNTICFYLRKEGGKQEFYSVDTLLSLTVSRNVSAFSCLSPPEALPDPPSRTAAADALTNLDGRLWRRSDCSGAGLGTGTLCGRYDLFAVGACYELIPQVSIGCGGVSGRDYDACGDEATAQQKDLDKVVSTVRLTRSLPVADPSSLVLRQIIYTPPLGYMPYTLKHGQIGIVFEYPDDPSWNFLDTEYEHTLTGKIALGGAQFNSRSFITVSFNPDIGAFSMQQEEKFKQFVQSNNLGLGYALNGDPHLPDAPKQVWKISGGPGVSGYFAMTYVAMGRVNGTLALSLSRCHSYNCTVGPPHEVLIEFLDLNNEIARHFLSSLRITMPGESHTITAGEKLSGF